MRPFAAAALGASLWWAGAACAQDRGASPPSPTPGGAPLGVNPLAGVAVSDMSAFLGRPLFSLSRRPAPQVASAAAAALAPPPPAAVPTADHLRLVGTLASQTGALALVQDTKRGETVSVAEGDTVDGWRVAGIQAALVRLERDGRGVSLEIFRPGPPPPPPPVAAAIGAPVAAAAPRVSAPVAPVPATTAPGAAPPGTVAGTAAASLAAQSPYRLTFGAPPPSKP